MKLLPKYSYQKNNQSFFLKIYNILKKRGFFYAIKKSFYKYIFPLFCLKFIKNRVFIFHNKKYNYFHHSYNLTWTNERAIEIPIIKAWIDRYSTNYILEIGNVLSHYFNRKWDVVDKYEHGDGVLNEDIVNFNPIQKYDLIVSISTLEHVGYDEEPKESNKILLAIENLKNNCLKKGGVMVITLPIDWNPFLDQMLWNKKLHFSETYYFKRINWLNIWEETNMEGVKNTKFSNPYIGANGLCIGIIKK